MRELLFIAIAVALALPWSPSARGEPLYRDGDGDYIVCGEPGSMTRSIYEQDPATIDCFERMGWPYGTGFTPVAEVLEIVGNPELELRCPPGGRGSERWREGGAIVTLARPFDARGNPHIVNTLLRDAFRRSRQACPFDFLSLPHLGFITIVAPPREGAAPQIVFEARKFGIGIWNETSFGPEGSVAGYEAAPRAGSGDPPPSHAANQGFLISPLRCGDPACRLTYQDAYTPGMMTSVMDHSLARNGNGFWQYGRRGNGNDGVVVAFNGETADGAAQDDDERCIRGRIELRPAEGIGPMVNGGGCGSIDYASYDEHPGYDYRAAPGTPVRAAASGRIVAGRDGSCILTNISSCKEMGYVGIDHGNDYISQYGHLSRLCVSAGQSVIRGQVIGFSGDTGVPGSPHLHFEVLRRVGNEHQLVDPYGWVGAPGADPLRRAAPDVDPANLWTRETTEDSRAPSC